MGFRKGQVEFIAILAIILIAIVVVVLSLQQTGVTPPEVSGIEQQAKTVKDSVNTLIKTGLKEQMKIIYNQGGTLSPQNTLNVDFGMFKVPVWQACDQVNIPDVAKEIGAGIASYLRANLKDEEEFFGKKTSFDFSKMEVDVDIFKDNLRVKVYLPTTIVDYNIPQPYEVSVPTKLYDILDFSRNFVNDNTQGRIFEGALIRCMSKFPVDPKSEDWLHYTGTLTKCGERIFKTKNDLLPPMQKAIKLTVAQTLWNEKPLRSIDKNCFTPINVVGGKAYPDLEVYFEYPPSWDSKLSQNFFFTPDPVNFVSTTIMPFIPICVAPYYVAYSVRYPVIVEVVDSLTNQIFKFAVMSEIVNNMPGNCSYELGEGELDYMESCVNNANCTAKVTVKDTEGNPVEGADVVFDVCDVGSTDSNGVVEGRIPCGVGELHVYKTGYKSFGDFLPANQLEDITVEIMKVQDNITLHFYGVPLTCGNPNGFGTNNLDCSNYTVEGKPSPITNLGELIVFSTFMPQKKSVFVPEDVDLILTNEVNGSPVDIAAFEGLYPNGFDVSAFVTRKFEIMMGYIDSSFQLETDDKDVYIYMPVVLKMEDLLEERDLNESISQDESEQLTTVLRNCGIEPVSTRPQNPTCV